ncbi:RICIN domain-containing protein [Micromonospora sp. M12]
MSTADGGLAVQWGDSGTADHNWVVITDGNAVRFRNVNSGKVLGVENMSTADNARVMQWADNGTADHRWILVNNGDGTYKIRNVNSNKLLGILNASTAWAHRPSRIRTTAARTTAGGSSPTPDLPPDATIRRRGRSDGRAGDDPSGPTAAVVQWGGSWPQCTWRT